MNAFRNAFKVIANRFAFLWTHIAYYTVTLFLLISISLSVLIPYINKIIENFNMMQRLSEIGQSIIDNNGFDDFMRLCRAFAADLGGIFAGGRELQSLLIFFLLSIISRFVLGFADMAFYHVIDMHLSSAARQSFRASFIHFLGKSAGYQLSKMLFSIPADAATFGLLYLVLYAFNAPLLLLFAPFLLLFAFVILYALRMALFSGWVPEILHSEDKRIFRSFFRSLKLFKNNFWRVYGAMLFCLVIIIALNVFFGIFTLGVGLFVTIPLTFYILMVLNSTLYYQNNNLRYYIDKNTIIN